MALFFSNDTATPVIYTLSLHDALPICAIVRGEFRQAAARKLDGIAAIGSENQRAPRIGAEGRGLLAGCVGGVGRDQRVCSHKALRVLRSGVASRRREPGKHE